jgi:hypothetical protein
VLLGGGAILGGIGLLSFVVAAAENAPSRWTLAIALAATRHPCQRCATRCILRQRRLRRTPAKG